MSEPPAPLPDELPSVRGEQLPDPEQMSLIDANIPVPVNPAIAANVRSDGSVG